VEEMAKFLKEAIICSLIGHNRKESLYPAKRLDEVNAEMGLETHHDKDEPIIVCIRCKKMLGFA
jgi:hypothetical protein